MRETVSPTLDQVLAFCAEEPVERVFLEDIARRGLGRFSAVAGGGGRLESLCHVGANIVPSGRGCADYAEAASRSGARMVIGEDNAVGELWEAARRRMPRPRDDRPGQPVYALRHTPEPGETGSARRVCSTSSCSCRPVPRRIGRRSASIRSSATPKFPLADAAADRGRTLVALGRGRRDPVQGGGLGVDTRGGAAAAGLGRPAGATPALRRRALSDLCRLLLEQVPAVCLFVRPENVPALGLYDSIGMTPELTYRSLVF